MAVPSTSLRILRGIPWDRNYQNLRRFSSSDQQLSYMNGKILFNLGDDFGYITKENNAIRVEKSQGDLLGANYIMYKNTSYRDKWFYAFITKIEYVSDGTSYIYYEEDYYQTWLFEITFGQCFVEREHSATDNIGDNTVPEGLETGPYVTAGNIENVGFFSTSGKIGNRGALNYCALVTEIKDSDGNWKNTTSTVNGIFNVLSVQFFETQSALVNFIQDYIDAGKVSDILSITQVPAIFKESNIGGTGTDTFSFNPNITNIDGYTPKNKKLFCSPYNFVMVTNGSGQSLQLKYELFYDSAYNLTIQCAASPIPGSILYPSSYENTGGNAYYNTITLNGFPTCGVTSDSFLAWWAQNKVGYFANAGLNAISAGVNISSGNYVGAATGILSSITGNIATLEQHYMAPDSASGIASAGSLQYSCGLSDFFIVKRCIRAEYAKIIDDYFQRFGYKTNRTKVPNITGRPYFNFVKTTDAEISGNLPIEAKERIQGALNAGTTFWHTNNICMYDVDNSPS